MTDGLRAQCTRGAAGTPIPPHPLEMTVTDQTADLTARLETIRRQMAAVAADRPTPEQMAEWNAADKATAQRIRAALPGVPLHHAYAVLQALRTVQRLDAMAEEPAVPTPATDRAAALTEWVDGHPQLEAIAAAVWEQCERGGNSTVWDDPRNIAVAALAAVLPAPTDQAAEIEQLHEKYTAGLRRADEINNQLMEEVQRYADGKERPVLWSVYNRMHQRALDAEAEADRLRRLAGEAQQDRECSASISGNCLREAQSETACDTEDGECVHGGQPAREAQQDPTQHGTEAHPPQHAWKVESPRRDQWASWGATYDDRDWACERYEDAISTAPARPFRMVRATTTYTVEAEHTPAAVARPGQPDTDAETPEPKQCARCSHGKAAHNVSGCLECPGGWRADHRFTTTADAAQQPKEA